LGGRLGEEGRGDEGTGGADNVSILEDRGIGDDGLPLPPPSERITRTEGSLEELHS